MSYNIPFSGWGLKEQVEDKNTIYEFNMKIGSAYGDGGWPEKGQGEAFRKEVYPKLEKAGFKINYSNGVGCDTIGEELPGVTHRYAYLHPAQFSGYMTKEDIDRLKEVVDNCPLTVKGANEVFRCKPVVVMTNNDYRELILSKLPEIVDTYRNFKYKASYKPVMAFAHDFIGEHGLKRAGGNSYGLGFDFDVLDTALEALDIMGALEKGKEEAKTTEVTEGKMSYKDLESAASYVMSELMEGADEDYAQQIKAEVGNDFLEQMGYSPLEQEEENELE